MTKISNRLKRIKGVYPEVEEELEAILTSWLKLKELDSEGYGHLEIQAKEGKLHTIHYHQVIKP